MYLKKQVRRNLVIPYFELEICVDVIRLEINVAVIDGCETPCRNVRNKVFCIMALTGYGDAASCRLDLAAHLTDGPDVISFHTAECAYRSRPSGSRMNGSSLLEVTKISLAHDDHTTAVKIDHRIQHRKNSLEHVIACIPGHVVERYANVIKQAGRCVRAGKHGAYHLHLAIVAYLAEQACKMLTQRLASACLELVSLQFSEPVCRGKLDIVRRVNPGSRIKLRSDVSAPSLASVNKQQYPIHKRIGCVESRILIILNALRLERQCAAHDMLVTFVSKRRRTSGIASQCAS